MKNAKAFNEKYTDKLSMGFSRLHLCAAELSSVLKSEIFKHFDVVECRSHLSPLHINTSHKSQ